MGKSNLYYFITRDRKTNEFSILDFDNKLENIDLYTIKYKDKSELLKELLDTKKITDIDTDIYIVSPNESDGNTYINYLNILYSDSKEIEDISKGFLNKNRPVGLINKVLNNFCYNMQFSDGFYDMVMLGKTALYSKFTEYFIGKRYKKTYDVKYDKGAWVQKSYLLLRNIYDAFSMYNNMYNEDTNYDDNIYRKLIEKQLLYKIGYGKCQNQMTLFDFNVFKDDNPTDEDKLLEIINTFSSFDRELFKYEDNKISFDTSSLNGVSEEDSNKLSSLLDKRLMRCLYDYYEHKKFNIVCNSDINNTFDRLIESDQKSLIEILKDKTIFDNAYSWIKVYNKYILGEEYGREKIKRD